MSIYCLSYAKIQVNIEYRKYIRIVLFSASITWRWVFLGDTDGSFRELTHCVREVNKHLIYIVILQTKVLLSVNFLFIPTHAYERFESSTSKNRYKTALCQFTVSTP